METFMRLTQLHSSDDEEIRFPRERNVNRITASDSDSDIIECNDTECDEDSIYEILQELITDKERIDDTKENTTEFSGRQKSFSSFFQRRVMS